MHIFGCQYDILWENRDGNFRKVEAMLVAQPIPEGSLIVLPEMFSSGFSMHVDIVAEADPSQAEAFLSESAKRYASWVIGGLVFRSSANPELGRNELAVFGPDGSLVGRYQKNHCFSYTGESDFYEAGSELLVFEAGGFRICPVICYDLRFPELFRRGVRQGADLFAVIANWPSVRIEHWRTLLKARAIENQAVVVGVNRTGEDPKYQYPGSSLILDEQGIVLAEGGPEESVISAEPSLESLQAWRKEFRALDDMR